MIIQLILITALALCAAYGLIKGGHSRWVRWPLILTSALGIYFVLQPEKTNQIAAALGVGRGADLLLYCWVIITLAMFVRLRLVQLQYHRQLTDLAREVALAIASRPQAQEVQPRDASAAPADAVSAPLLDEAPQRPQLAAASPPGEPAARRIGPTPAHR